MWTRGSRRNSGAVAPMTPIRSTGVLEGEAEIGELVALLPSPSPQAERMGCRTRVTLPGAANHVE